MRRRIKPNVVYSTILKPGERATDKRYKDGVDTGRFSSNRVPLPLKPLKELPVQLDDEIPKQKLRQKQANRHYKNK